MPSPSSKDFLFFDTETTGLDPDDGDRVIEIAMIRTSPDLKEIGRYHGFFNPGGKKIAEGAFRVHGIRDDFLLDKPSFAEALPQFSSLMMNAKLTAHNARFDMGFLAAEFRRASLDFDPFTESVFDTLDYARQRHPGQKATLDALCDRYGVSRVHREKHGAMVDTELMIHLYDIMRRLDDDFSLMVPPDYTQFRMPSSHLGMYIHQPALEVEQEMSYETSPSV